MYQINVYDQYDRLICLLSNQTPKDVANLLAQCFKELRLEVKEKL